MIKLLPAFLLGTLLVFQPGINRNIMTQKGLGFAILLNGAVLFVLTFSFFVFLKWGGDKVPELFRLKSSGNLHFWYVLSGIFGFSLVACVPLVLASVGAVSTVVGMLAGQMITAILWDAFLEGHPPTFLRLSGLALALAGALLTQWGRG